MGKIAQVLLDDVLSLEITRDEMIVDITLGPAMKALHKNANVSYESAIRF